MTINASDVGVSLEAGRLKFITYPPNGVRSRRCTIELTPGVVVSIADALRQYAREYHDGCNAMAQALTYAGSQNK